MKKLGQVIIASAILSSSLFAISIEDVKKNITEAMKGPLRASLQGNPYKDKLLSQMKIEFLGIKKVKDFNNAYIAFLKIKFAGSQKYLAVLAFKDGQIVTPLNTLNFFVKDGVYRNSELEKLVNKVKMKALEEQQLALKKASDNFVKMFEAKKDAYIYMDNGKKETKVLFLDPNCPFCVKKLRSGELRNLTDKYNVLIMFTPLVTLDKNNKVIKNESLHPYAMHISNLIIKNAKGKSTKEQIKVLSKYMYVYNPYKPEEKFKNEKEDKEINKKLAYTVRKYIDSGVVKGTPTVYTLDEKQTKKLLKKLKNK